MSDYTGLTENVDAINHIIATAGKLERMTGIPADDLLDRAGYGSVSMDAHIAGLNRYLSSKRELAAVNHAIDTGDFVLDENATDADIRKAYGLLEKRRNYLKTVVADAPESDDAKYTREDVSNALVAAMIEKQVPPHILSAYRQNVDDVLVGDSVCLAAEKPTKGKIAKYLLITGALAAALGLSGCVGDSPTGSTVPSDAVHAAGPLVFHEDTGLKYAGKDINVFVPTDGYLDDDDLHDNIDVYGDRSLEGEGLPYDDVRRVKVMKDDNGFVELVVLEGKTPGNEMRIYDNNHKKPIDRVEMDLAGGDKFIDADADGVWDVDEDNVKHVASGDNAQALDNIYRLLSDPDFDPRGMDINDFRIDDDELIGQRGLETWGIKDKDKEAFKEKYGFIYSEEIENLGKVIVDDRKGRDKIGPVHAIDIQVGYSEGISLADQSGDGKIDFAFMSMGYNEEYRSDGEWARDKDLVWDIP